jgi:ferritin-like metal-binding protein YciE
MPSTHSLKDVYVEELRDLWSANDQMQEVMKGLGQKAKDTKLKKTLEQSVGGIAKHTETLRSLLEANGGKSGKERCQGMEGLVREARKHVEAAAGDDELSDLAMIAQYQRMSHYGLAGFGTAAAYAKALGLKDDEAKLKGIVGDIYKADEFSSRMAEQLEKASAKKN